MFIYGYAHVLCRNYALYNFKKNKYKQKREAIFKDQSRRWTKGLDTVNSFKTAGSQIQLSDRIRSTPEKESPKALYLKT